MFCVTSYTIQYVLIHMEFMVDGFSILLCFLFKIKYSLGEPNKSGMVRQTCTFIVREAGVGEGPFRDHCPAKERPCLKAHIKAREMAK